MFDKMIDKMRENLWLVASAEFLLANYAYFKGEIVDALFFVLSSIAVLVTILIHEGMER